MRVIDCHAHLLAPDSLYAYRSSLLATGGFPRVRLIIADEALAASAAENVRLLDEVGTDVQLLSPRPYQQMHSAKPVGIVHQWIAENNDLIARTCELYPTRFAGVAGLPTCHGEPVERALPELERAVTGLGFVAVSVNPDPAEGLGCSPPMGDRYWYPLYEKVVELDVPIFVHSSGCHSGRESYSEHFITEESIAILTLVRSEVFVDFPDLNIVIAHGGGSVPYQLGRWEAERFHPGLGGSVEAVPFRDSLRLLWFDTVLHRPASLALLFDVVGHDRCVFGSERPGSASTMDPQTGRPFDDIKGTINSLGLAEESRRAVFEANPLKVVPRLTTRLESRATDE